jgi:hypothetical protein
MVDDPPPRRAPRLDLAGYESMLEVQAPGLQLDDVGRFGAPCGPGQPREAPRRNALASLRNRLC